MIGDGRGDYKSSLSQDKRGRQDSEGRRRRGVHGRRRQRRRRRRQDQSDGVELSGTGSLTVSEHDDDDDDDDDVGDCGGGGEAAAATTTSTTTTENVELDARKPDDTEQRDALEPVFRTPVCSLSATE